MKMINSLNLYDSYTYAPDGQSVARYSPPSAEGASGDTTYSYDAESQLQKINHPGGRTLSYSYDAGGNVTAIAISGSGATAKYNYNKGGQLLSSTSSDNINTSYSYDGPNRIAETISGSGSGAINRGIYSHRQMILTIQPLLQAAATAPALK
jgi:YD repeat-containing protein